MCAYMHTCLCVCGLFGGLKEKEMALWIVCVQRRSKEHSPRRPRALDCTTSNDRIKRGQRDERGRRQRVREREREREINWLCQWLSLLIEVNIEKTSFSFSCAMSSSVLGVMECVCGPVSCHCRRCFCVSESDDGRPLVWHKIFLRHFKYEGK